jgi:hypothetical protein
MNQRALPAFIWSAADLLRGDSRGIRTAYFTPCLQSHARFAPSLGSSPGTPRSMPTQCCGREQWEARIPLTALQDEHFLILLSDGLTHFRPELLSPDTATNLTTPGQPTTETPTTVSNEPGAGDCRQCSGGCADCNARAALLVAFAN